MKDRSATALPVSVHVLLVPFGTDLPKSKAEVVGLPDPRTGREAYACVQLRLENLMADSYNIVGFQTKLKIPEQQRVFRMIPGLENAEFLRYGQIHRNTYINGPALLAPSSHLGQRTHRRRRTGRRRA